MRTHIEQRGNHWYVLYPWWWRLPLPGFNPSPLMRGSDAFDEVPIGFISKEIAEAAAKKYPDGYIALELPFLPPDELLTVRGQKALLK